MSGHLIKDVRVDANTVIVTAGGNDQARDLCGYLLRMKEAAAEAQPSEPVAYKIRHPNNPKCFYLSTTLPEPTRTDTGEPDEYYGGTFEPLYAAPVAQPVVPQSRVDELALVLLDAWKKAEPDSSITQYPTSYIPTFVDMARAALAAAPAAPAAQPTDWTQRRESHIAMREAHCADDAHAFWTARQGVLQVAPSVAFNEGYKRGFDRAVELLAAPTAQPGAAMSLIHSEAAHLVALAAENGLVLTIEQRPLQPLAMGNYETTVSVRPMRGRS
jgi:hypothetical protein